MSIGCHSTLAPFLVSRIIEGYSHVNPNVAIRVYEGTQEHLIHHLGVRDADMLLTYQEELPDWWTHSTLVAELVRAGATYYSDEYAVLDADGLVIETHTVSFNTPSGGAGVNEGFFFGIASGANDIKSLVVTDGYVALDDLRFTTAVPEPATVGLMLIGLAAVGAGAARRRRD